MKVVEDRQTNGAQFAATDLLEADTYDSFNNLANKERFRVLKSVNYVFNATAGASVASPAVTFGKVIQPVDEHLNLNLPIEYDNSATTGVITSVRSNSIWVVFQASTTNLVQSDIKMRIRYTDI